MKKILIMHGPNLNLLGEREPGIYGDTNFETLNAHLVELAASLGLEAEVFQSNHEGALIDKLRHFGRHQGHQDPCDRGAYQQYLCPGCVPFAFRDCAGLQGEHFRLRSAEL